MKKKTLVFIAFILISIWTNSVVNAQGIGINPSGNPPDPSAMLDVSSTTKGTLITRMTTGQRDAIVNPAEGLQIFNLTSRCLEIYANGVWQTTFCSCTTPAAPTAGTNTATETQIVWNWNVVSGATGYKYSTVNNYSLATDNATNTSFTQAGLTCGTNYTLYVWAYSVACSSAVTTLTEATSTCCVVGTGGTITSAGSRTIHSFTSSGTFTINCPVNAEVLVVAGGGGGGGVIAGGGGGGGVIYQSSFPVAANTYTVTVGDGGLGGYGYQGPSHNSNQPGLQGGNSIFSTLTAIGGGGGAGWKDVDSNNPSSSGGSGGGGGANGNGAGSPGTPGQGNDGGSGNNDGNHGAGGGGAGAAGQNYPPGSGGNGFLSSISGTPTYYGGGGGGGTRSGAGSGQSGGAGGGGAGNDTSVKAGNGVANTGGGGGGAGFSGENPTNRIGGDGGSGIVIISYVTP